MSIDWTQEVEEYKKQYDDEDGYRLEAVYEHVESLGIYTKLITM